MQVLPKGNIESAALECVVEVAAKHHFGEGYGPWSTADAKAFMSKRRRQYSVGGFLSETLGPHAFLWLDFAAAVAVGALVWMLSLYAPVKPTLYWTVATPAYIGMIVFCWNMIHKLFDGTYWQTNPVRTDGTYPREFVNHTLPPQVEALRITLKGMLNHPDFEVSFIGRDPVLWVIHSGAKVPAVIWDELPNGDIELVRTPSK